jgi:hypothetical protein
MALPAVAVLTLVIIALTGGIVTLGLSQHGERQQDVHRLKALNAADAGLARVVEDIWDRYRAASPEQRVDLVDALDGKYCIEDRIDLMDEPFGQAFFDASVVEVVRDGDDHADVRIQTVGRSGDVVRKFTAVVRFGRRASKVFDYAYFINNFGWLWGSTITVHGDVRSNGDFSLKNAKVNGDVYASRNEELSTLGTIGGESRHDDLATYYDTAGDRARPGSPTCAETEGEDRNENGIPDEYEYRAGYDGESERKDAQEVIDMPYLGNLESYEDLAARRGGKILVGGSVVVDGSHEGTLVLEGTAENPIEVTGPVVVNGDVIIKGVVKGQGTIYAGRNVHVAGDIHYENPPTWSKPSSDPAADARANEGCDLVGLVARGSIIMGDYTDSGWKSSTANYLKPPFTQEYVVPASDADIGYVTGCSSNGEPTFHGDYTKEDGGTKTDGTARRFFESSLSDENFHAFAGGEIRHVDAVLYTNHLISGRIGEFELNGTIVCRDEAMIYSGSFTLNYDPRIHGNGYESIDIQLPRAPMRKLLLWQEGT